VEPKKPPKKKQVNMIDQVIFNEDGTYTFPKEWNRNQKKRISGKIKKRRRAGYVFPITLNEEEKACEEEQKKVINQPEIKKKMDVPLGKDGKPLLTENVSLKIVDLGNGCWTHHHFSTEI